MKSSGGTSSARHEDHARDARTCGEQRRGESSGDVTAQVVRTPQETLHDVQPVVRELAGLASSVDEEEGAKEPVTVTRRNDPQEGGETEVVDILILAERDRHQASPSALCGSESPPASMLELRVLAILGDDLLDLDVRLVRRVESPEIPLVDPAPHVLAHALRESTAISRHLRRLPVERSLVDLLQLRVRALEHFAGGLCKLNAVALMTRMPSSARAAASSSPFSRRRFGTFS